MLEHANQDKLLRDSGLDLPILNVWYSTPFDKINQKSDKSDLMREFLTDHEDDPLFDYIM